MPSIRAAELMSNSIIGRGNAPPYLPQLMHLQMHAPSVLCNLAFATEAQHVQPLS